MRRAGWISLTRRLSIPLLCTLLACSTTGPAATGGDPSAPAPGPSDPAGGAASADPALPDPNTGPTQAQTGGRGALGARTESAVEGLIIGTVVGGQIAGPYGAAVGAGLFGLYGFITGDVPFETGRSGGSPPADPRRGGHDPIDSDEALDREIDEEMARMDDLEREIEEELRRQEELLEQIDKQEAVNESIREEQVERARSEAPDALAAPLPPYERSIPDSIFDTKTIKTPEGKRVQKVLDADRDGKPEIETLIDPKTGQVLSRSEDTDYDGRLDSHATYANGQIASLEEDTNHDGTIDRWTSYENGRGTRVETDRDFDGKRDGFKVFQGGVLAVEEHDTNGDGKVDRRVEYGNRRRTFEREDRDGNGSLEFVTVYDEQEFPVRTERDSNGDGKPDVWEFYEGKDPSNPILARKEEDADFDGKADIKSYYRKGKLVRKEVSDPTLMN